MTHDIPPSSEALPPLKKAWLFFWRAARWQCPVCGRAPLYRSVGEMRNFNDWLETLPGCPHCDYTYDRESGYFMLALWSLDYGVAAIFGIGLLLILLNFFTLSTGQLLLWTMVPTFIFALLIVRHAKAFYLAIDHYFFHNDGS